MRRLPPRHVNRLSTMRICFLSRRFFPAISGMSVYAINYLREMVALGHDIVMISQYRNDDAGTKIYGGGPPPPVEGVKVIGLESVGEQRVNQGRPADFESDLAAMVTTALAEHQEKPFDIVHAQYGYPNGLAALEISQQTGIPNAVSIQGGDGHWVGLCCDTHQRGIRAVFDHANELIIGSRSFAEEVHENHGTPMDRFTIIPGAINAKRFTPSHKRRLGDLSPTPHLLYHGRVDERKGVLELLDAVKQLHDRHISLRLTISGIGPDLERARTKTIALGLEGSVDLRGYVDYQDVPKIYREADLFVSPTWSEGFSNTILEAMASGLPIVAARSVGVVDCLTHEHDALFHDVHDVGGLADAIERVIQNETLRRKLAVNALAEIGETYAWPVIARRLEARLQALSGIAPDNAWAARYNPLRSIADADLSCRFRAAPHLL